MTSIRNLLARFGDLLAIVQSAVAVSHAADNGRKPAAGDLLLLGIDPSAFARIGRG